MSKYNLEYIKGQLRIGQIKGKDIWKLFGIEGKAQTKTKNSILKQLDRICKYEKINNTTFNIIEIYNDIQEAQEHKNKGNTNRVGKYKLQEGSLTHLYTRLIMSRFMNDHNLILTGHTKKQLASRFGIDFKTETEGEKYIELWKYQYFKNALSWLIKTGNLIENGADYVAKTCEVTTDEDGNIDYILDGGAFTISNKEDYDEYLQTKKDIFNKHYKDKYGSMLNLENYGGLFAKRDMALKIVETLDSNCIGHEYLKDDECIYFVYEKSFYYPKEDNDFKDEYEDVLLATINDVAKKMITKLEFSDAKETHRLRKKGNLTKEDIIIGSKYKEKELIEEYGYDYFDEDIELKNVKYEDFKEDVAIEDFKSTFTFEDHIAWQKSIGIECTVGVLF